MPAEKPKSDGWLAKRREKQRLKRERTGDSPQKQVERPKSGGDDQSVKDVADRVGTTGFIAGGF